MDKRGKEANRVTIVGFFVNLLLTLIKITAGVVGKSSAMIADGVHSLSDFITDIVVIIFINIAGKDIDDNHKYGHGKFETFATLIISLVLAGVGLGIFVNGLEKIIEFIKSGKMEQPGMIALWAAIISIISKEALYRYTIVVGKRINSPAVIANGWHHRSDAFSSIGTALGISGAIFLGESWRILDPIAGMVVSFFIVKVAWDLGMPSVKELLDTSLPEDIVEEIENVITSHPEVINFHHLKTRKVGTIYAIEVHIKLDKIISFVRSHDIATEVETSIREKYGVGTHITIHTEPI